MPGGLIGFLNLAGGACCSIGGLLALISVFKGREARLLSTATSVDSLADLHQLVGLVPLLIAVTGRVFADRTVKCELSDSEGAIVEYKEEQKSERRQSTYWYTDVVLLRDSLRETAWSLVDASGIKLPVVHGRMADGDVLQMSADVWVPSPQSGVIVAMAGQVMGNRPLGVRKVERFLPLGTVLTAVGELAAVPEQPGAFKGAVRSGGRVLVLREPAGGGAPFRLSHQPLPELIASLQDSSRTCANLARVLAIVGTGMLAVSFAHRLWVWHRQRKMHARVERARREREQARSAAGAGSGEGSGRPQLQQTTCVMCLDRECELVFRCGHLCVCSSCGANLRKCPLCRSNGAPIRVYLS